jgi:hypothetical protein
MATKQIAHIHSGLKVKLLNPNPKSKIQMETKQIVHIHSGLKVKLPYPNANTSFTVHLN